MNRDADHDAGRDKAQGRSLRDRIWEIATHCGCSQWNEAKVQGSKGNCPLCGQWKLSVGVAKKGNVVGVTCWSPICRGSKEARDKIFARLVADGFDLGPDRVQAPQSPPEADAGQEQPAPAGKKTRAPKPAALEKQVSGLREPERRVLLSIAAMAADRHGWIRVTQRMIAAGCKVAKRDAVSMLRRIQAEHGLIEVQKNGFKKKRATKVRFTVNRDDLVVALGGYPNAKAMFAGMRRKAHSQPASDEPMSTNYTEVVGEVNMSDNYTDAVGEVTMSDEVTTPVNMRSTWSEPRHVLITAPH